MKHIHKYKRFKTVKGKDFWRCMIPNCTHVLYDRALLLGRPCLCWYCNEGFLLYDVEQAKPVCRDCKEVRKEKREQLKRIS